MSALLEKKVIYAPVTVIPGSERKLAVILERETEKWFRPAKGQFQMFYRKGSDLPPEKSLNLM